MGSHPPTSLLVSPSSASVFYNLQTGTLTNAQLTAVFNDGSVPSSVQWSSDQGCVEVGNGQSTVVVACNGLCGTVNTGYYAATITATAQGLSGTSSVNCFVQ